MSCLFEGVGGALSGAKLFGDVPLSEGDRFVSTIASNDILGDTSLFTASEEWEPMEEINPWDGTVTEEEAAGLPEAPEPETEEQGSDDTGEGIGAMTPGGGGGGSTGNSTTEKGTDPVAVVMIVILILLTGVAVFLLILVIRKWKQRD